MTTTEAGIGSDVAAAPLATWVSPATVDMRSEPQLHEFDQCADEVETDPMLSLEGALSAKCLSDQCKERQLLLAKQEAVWVAGKRITPQKAASKVLGLMHCPRLSNRAAQGPCK